MRSKKILRPTTTFTGVVLDARISDKIGKELQQEIFDSVAHTQKFILTELPSILIVTQQQFASLNAYTEEMYHTTDRMFRTPHNVMEVQIDREYNTIGDIDDIMSGVEELTKLEEKTDEQISTNEH